MRRFFMPAIAVMDRLEYLKKFTLIFGSILILIGGVMYILLSNLNSQVEFNAKENYGVEYINPTKDFLVELHNFKDWTYHQVVHSDNIQSEINVIVAKADKNVDAISKVDKEYNGILKVENRWNDIKNDWNSIKANYKNLSLEDFEKQRSKIVNDTISLIAYVNDTSNLILDPDLDTFYLMDAFGLRLPQLLNNINSATIEVAKNIEEHKNNRVKIIKTTAMLEDLNSQLLTGIEVIYNNNDSLKPLLESTFQSAINSNKEFIAALNSVVSGNYNDFEKIKSLSDKTYKYNVALYETYSDNLHRLVAKRVKGYADQRPTSVIFTLVVLFVIGYIFAGFYYSVIGAIDKISVGSENIANGDLTVVIDSHTNDEIKYLADSINKIRENLKNMISDVANTTSQVAKNAEAMSEASNQTAEGSNQVAQSISQLAEGTQDQIHNVGQGLEKIEIINNAIQVILDKSKETSEISSQSEQVATDGKLKAQEAAAKINQIKDMAKEVSVTINELGELSVNIEEIIALIKGIASQTNLLALNAAIEAARAGEHGKGFAVVAEEVKKLAGESAEATEKITDMIKEIQAKTELTVNSMEEAVQEVDEGVLIVENTGVSLDEILNASQETSVKISEISSELTTVSDESDEILKMMENISAITEESSASAEEISSISEEQSANTQEISASAHLLVELSEGLSKKVSTFKV